MNSFEFCIPTKIIFGEGTIQKVGEQVKTYGSKVMVVSYEKSILESIGLYSTIVDSLREAGLEIVEHFGVKSNPVISHVRKGVEILRGQKADVLLAVGGGSVIDEAKAIAAAALYEGDPWDFFCGKAEIDRVLPVVTILTIPATSSEMNPTTVITNEETKRKVGLPNPNLYPKVSILDPTVTLSIPKQLTAFTAADIISHLLEGYLTHKDEWAPIQDGIMETLLKTVIESTDKIMKNPSDYQARATLMWAGSLAWNGLPVAGVGPFGYPMHMVEHTLSAFYDIHHGAGMSVVIPGWMRYDSKIGNKRYIRFAKNVFGIDGNNDDAAQKGIKALEDWFVKIGTPVSFASAKLPVNELDAIADDILVTAKEWAMNTWYTRDQVLDILKMCL